MQNLHIKPELWNTLQNAKSLFVPKSPKELLHNIFTNDPNRTMVSYDLSNLLQAQQKINPMLANQHLPHCQDCKAPWVTEAEIVRCQNGIAVNFCQDYMRKRDPNSLYIADSLPTDKPRFDQHFAQPFDALRAQTLAWLQDQDLLAMPFLTGGTTKQTGYPSLLIAPKNATFFAYAVSQLQHFVCLTDWKGDFVPNVCILLAPPFRHTHFEGKQVVVHNRTQDLYELFSFNLYPGPSAKKGLYGFLLHQSTLQNQKTTPTQPSPFLTAHASCAKVITPYQNELVIMHEGASGGGKTEMCEPIPRLSDGKILLATHTVTKDPLYLLLSETSEIQIVSDDMLTCHLDDQQRLIAQDAEIGWFLRVDNVTSYGTQPEIEKISVHPKEPLCFFNLQAIPASTCLLWQHAQDSNGQQNQNPRIIVPRHHFENALHAPTQIDVRSFGIRTPPATQKNPSYGILGMLHILPPALAFVWRLLAPRGYNNPSILSETTTQSKAPKQNQQPLQSEGVGTFWPFASGCMTDYANQLLAQITHAKYVQYVLIPNQHIGCYQVDFASQCIVREYLARHGTRFAKDRLTPARLPLLGYEPLQLKINGQYMPTQLLHTQTQPELGLEGYDAGAQIWTDFAKDELQKYTVSQRLHPNTSLCSLGKQIIDLVLQDALLCDYEKISKNFLG